MAAEEFFRNLPKVTLHDHLDGGLRPATMIEIAAEVGHQLPSTDLTSWAAGSTRPPAPLVDRLLTTFEHTIACMQRADDLRRVAREWWPTMWPTGWSPARRAGLPNSTCSEGSA